MDGRKFWTCKNGHLLGEVDRAKVEKNVSGTRIVYHTTRLTIFRLALLPVNNDVARDDAGVLTGRMLMGFSWTCSICKAQREWHPDEEAQAWLKKHFEKRGV